MYIAGGWFTKVVKLFRENHLLSWGEDEKSSGLDDLFAPYGELHDKLIADNFLPVFQT